MGVRAIVRHPERMVARGGKRGGGHGWKRGEREVERWAAGEAPGAAGDDELL